MSTSPSIELFPALPNDVITIDKSCVETEPCYHNVFVERKFYREMDGVGIVELLQEHNQSIPEHFKCYVDYEELDVELFS